MSTRIRLQRHGKKRYAYYHIVVADQKSKRDGKSIERLGEYDPNSNPAIINLDFDRALYWLQTGAQPSDTMRAILSYKGVMYKNHLLNGVKKGAHTEEEVEKKFAAWMAEKDDRIQAKRDKIKQSIDSDLSERIAAESKIKDARATEILAKQAPVEVPVEESADAPAADATEAAPAAEEAAPVEEAAPAAEAPAVEETAPAAETPAAEVAPAVEEAAPAAETPVAEEAPAVEEEAPAAETPAAEEAPAAEAPAEEAPEGDAPAEEGK